MTDTDRPAPRPYHQTDFPPEEFADRRGRVLERIGNNAVAVVQGLGASGAFDIFRQSNEFYYLSGVELPHACLLLDGARRKSVLYLLPRDAKLERSEGALLNADDASAAIALTGFDDVRPLDSLADDVRETRSIYALYAPAEGRQACRDTLLHARGQIDADPFDGRPSDEAYFRSRLAATAVHAEFHDLSPILDELRMIKSPRELALMRRAGRLTAQAVTEAMRSTRPGLMEYHLGAAADYVFSINGARGGGYRPIIACGSNIWNAHYYRNNAPLVDGELVLMDYAPDCGYYTSDIGRIWPVSGRYSAWQRELYGFIVEYHKALLGRIRPGVTADVVMDEAAADMEPVVDRTTWSNPAFERSARATLEFRGHLSHGVGMAVHDVADYRRQPLQASVVFALDPQMWVPEEEIYIRVEDTIAITDGGFENLTCGAPLELDDVERLQRETPKIAVTDLIVDDV